MTLSYYSHRINNKSSKNRIAISFFSNFVKSVFSLATGLLIARQLGPNDFGILSFLLASFTALRSILDMGSSNAFFSFISKKNQTKIFFITYLFWLLVQFILSILFIGLFAPNQSLYKQVGIPNNEQPVKPVTYSVIKHGLIGLTKYLATYWADNGVRCNALCPGGIYNNQPDEFVNKISNLIPLGRMAHEDDYKASVVFMVSDASSYMNGSRVSMDGGRNAW